MADHIVVSKQKILDLLEILKNQNYIYAKEEIHNELINVLLDSPEFENAAS